jgi:ubiquinone/menaquinone biosynthesis C-methylase UbiE
VRPVDYDVTQYQNYQRGRALSPAQRETWIAAYAARLPEARPLRGLDLGSGTGRYTRALAEAFGPVVGVEPSERMRELARAADPGLDFRAGSAEAIPLGDATVDYALLFLVWHHIADKARAVRELTRVAAPGATLLLRAQFRDRMPRPWWLAYFPRGYEADASMYESLGEVTAWFAPAPWRVAALDLVPEYYQETKAAALERLRLRPYSTFEQFTADEARIGFERLERAVAEEPDAMVPLAHSTLLTLVRDGER